MTFKTIRMKPVLDELLLTADMTWQARLEAHRLANVQAMVKRRSDAGKRSWETRRARHG